MGASGNYICPSCGFIYAQYEHMTNETMYNCSVCGWEGWKSDHDHKVITRVKASPKVFKYSKIIKPIMTKLWQDEWCSEIFQYDVDSYYLPDHIEKHGLGGVFVHLFTVDMS